MDGLPLILLVLGALAVTAVSLRFSLPAPLALVVAGLAISAIPGVPDYSLFNDATALTALRVAVAAGVGAGFSLWSGLGEFLLVGVGGVALGAVLGRVVHQARLRLRDARLESALGLVVPFAAYALAEQVHFSGVLAVVVTGLYLGHHAPRLVMPLGYRTRQCGGQRTPCSRRSSSR